MCLKLKTRMEYCLCLVLVANYMSGMRPDPSIEEYMDSAYNYVLNSRNSKKGFNVRELFIAYYESSELLVNRSDEYTPTILIGSTYDVYECTYDDLCKCAEGDNVGVCYLL